MAELLAVKTVFSKLTPQFRKVRFYQLPEYGELDPSSSTSDSYLVPRPVQTDFPKLRAQYGEVRFYGKAVETDFSKLSPQFRKVRFYQVPEYGELGQASYPSKNTPEPASGFFNFASRGRAARGRGPIEARA